jgi:hypothetical protein
VLSQSSTRKAKAATFSRENTNLPKTSCLTFQTVPIVELLFPANARANFRLKLSLFVLRGVTQRREGSIVARASH